MSRVFGLETEYVLSFAPARAGVAPPTRETVHDAIVAAVGRRVRSIPSRLRKPGAALATGGFLQYEHQMPAHHEGVIEAATPECVSPRDVVAWSAAQDRLLAESLREAERALEHQGHVGTIVLGKNNFGVEGHAVGSHENYWVRDRVGPGAWALRLVGFPLLLPLWLAILATPWVVQLAALAVLLVVAGVALALRALARWPVVGRAVEPAARALARGLRRAEPWVEELPLRVIAFFVYRVFRPVVPLFSGFFAATCFTRYRAAVATHAATRIVFTGAGTLALDAPGCPSAFQISQRADRLARVARVFWDDRGRPFIDLKELFLRPLLLFAPRKRLQVLAGDSNMSQVAEWLRFGTTDLVLRLAEAGQLDGAPRLRDPVGAIREIARDPTLRVRVATRAGGHVTALQAQRWLLDRAAAAFGAEGGETAEVLRAWRQVLERLERDPASARGQVDWVTKRELMLHAAGGEAAFAEIARLRPVRALAGTALDAAPDSADGATLRARVCGGRRPASVARIEALVAETFDGWDELARVCASAWRLRKVDLRYHHVDLQGGYYYRLLGQGEMERVVPDELVERAMADPPAGTRAALRGRLVRRIAAERWGGWASWTKVRIRDLRRVIGLGSPLDADCSVLATLPGGERAP